MPLKITGLKKYYTGLHGDSAFKTLVLDNINFTVPLGEDSGKIVTVLAPFGAGKSTLLKIVAAIESPSEGKIFLHEKEYTEPDGSIVYIPENPSSFPWLTVKDNIQFGLKDPGAAKDIVNNLISTVGLAGYEDHIPHNKSIGFRFRISLARALAANPSVVLIDDSFRNMKPDTKKEIYDLVIRIKDELKINFLAATTNIHEAILLSDEILLMKKDPGTIFKSLSLPDGLNRRNQGLNESIMPFRNEIESYFRGENIEGSINFSI